MGRIVLAIFASLQADNSSHVVHSFRKRVFVVFLFRFEAIKRLSFYLANEDDGKSRF